LLAGLLTTGVIVFINNVGTKVYDYFVALDSAIPPAPAP
jgi:Flp pilus assembly pilin Flp